VRRTGQQKNIGAFVMPAQPSERNAFLARLSASELALLRPHLASLELRVDDYLHYLGDKIEEVIFPRSGLISLSIPVRDGAGAAILVGREGILGGYAAAAAAPATCDAEVCIGGTALRMPATVFCQVLEQSSSIRRLAAQFDIAMLAQAQQTALCNAAHPVEARICRLLLEVDGHNELGRVPLTQATIGRMLSVRRTTVTLVAQRLEIAGVVNCRRGYMQIVSREEMERRACECYSHLKQSRERLFAAPEAITPVGPSLRASMAAGKAL
jgi:CRP-like cAMP-binding protein